MNNHKISDLGLDALTRQRLNRLNEPQKTRVLFYLRKLLAGKTEGEKLVQADIDLALGRAAGDLFADEEAFRGDSVSRIDTSCRTICLQDVIDGTGANQ